MSGEMKHENEQSEKRKPCAKKRKEKKILLKGGQKKQTSQIPSRICLVTQKYKRQDGKAHASFSTKAWEGGKLEVLTLKLQ